MALGYGFNDEQREILDEMMKPEYQEMFSQMIAS
jgi:plasmid stability protein